MNTNNTQQTTFWNFLKNHKIEIPIIQRDYAQGRIGKEKLREKFLEDLKNALDGKFSNDEKALKLDFVYGSLEKNSLNLLDGQQRLTTLWLLHWYIAYKSGHLTNNRDVFQNFTYETRISSREFCSKLSEFTEPIDNESLVRHIQNQTWFFSDWKQDPTIQAMLNMLGGTPIKESKDNDILDGIEEVFKDCEDSKYSYYWDKLTGDNCPIIFYYLDLLGLKLSDDLYIKMNARGKQLTSFENFKADLVGHIKNKKWEEGITDPKETFAHKMDTSWTEIFWKNKSSEYKIDDIYFAFLNRYFFNNLITAKKADGTDCTQNEIESKRLFKYLYDKSGNDSNIKYEGFDVYNTEESFNNELLFERLKKTLDNFHSAYQSKEDINRLFLPSWDDNFDFCFIPKYNPKATDENDAPKSITTLTQPQRVIFYAICCYFENNQYDETIFQQWMRIVWNIVENANIATIQSMIGTMRLIDELKPHANDIYNFLADNATTIKSDSVKEQVAEEREKARQIVKDNSMENHIKEAEKYAFFKGAIRFLFTNRDGDGYDWSFFDCKFEKAQAYFDKDGVKQDYQKDAILLKSLISRANDPWGTVWGHYRIFNHYGSTWKNLLINPKWNKAVSSILLGDLSIEDSSTVAWHRKLYRTNLLVYIAKELPYSWIRDIHGHRAIYPSSEGVFLNAKNRDKILSQLLNENKISLLDGESIPNTNLFKGWNINFQYNGAKFQWSEDDKIYLLDSNKQRLKTQDQSWVCFDSKEKDILDDFIKELDNLSSKEDII